MFGQKHTWSVQTLHIHQSSSFKNLTEKLLTILGHYLVNYLHCITLHSFFYEPCMPWSNTGGATLTLRHSGESACGIPFEDTIVLTGGNYVTRWHSELHTHNSHTLKCSTYDLPSARCWHMAHHKTLLGTIWLALLRSFHSSQNIDMVTLVVPSLMMGWA